MVVPMAGILFCNVNNGRRMAILMRCARRGAVAKQCRSKLGHFRVCSRTYCDTSVPNGAEMPVVGQFQRSNVTVTPLCI